MGKLQTAVGLPKRILLQGWDGDQDSEDINGEYIYGKFTPPQIGQERSGYIRQGGYLAYIFFNQGGNIWVHYSSDTGWTNTSTNPNVLPYTGWITADGQGPAGSITILENISAKNNKISIKKQNLGGGKIKLYKNSPPTTLPLSTPNLYVSGLSVIIPPEYTNYANPTFGNPLIRQNNTTWSNGASYGGLLLSSQNVWYLYVGIEQFSEEDGWQNQTFQVALNYGGTESIPLTGWVTNNPGGITIEGIVILSTTP